MSNKLSNSDRQRVSDALTECARKTKDIDDPVKLADAAYSILSAKLGDRPGLFKAACQVYNSCKSIHKLSEASDDTRGNSFSILNVQDMSDRLHKDTITAMRKAASVPAKFSTVSKPAELSEMRKTASAVTVRREPEFKLTKAPKVELNDVKRFIREELEDIESVIRKSASRLRNAEIAYMDAFDSFVAAFATESAGVRKEAAARLYANFHEPADELIQEFGHIRPLQKLATASYNSKYVGTPTLLNTPIYGLAKQAMDLKVAFAKARKNHEDILNEMSESAIKYSNEYMSMNKQAAAAEAAIAGGAMGGLTKLLGLEPADDSSIQSGIFTTEAMNSMLAHSYRRAFMKAATQDAISRYSLDKIVSAFNRAVAKLPPNTRMVPATANQQLIESIMIDELAKGSVPSKADTEVIATLADSLGKLKTDKGIYEGNTIYAK